MKFLSGSAVLLSLLVAGCQTDTRPAAATAASSEAATPEVTTKPAAKSGGAVLFFGDSITAGLGVEPEQAYPALIGAKLDSLRLPYPVINAGLSGETSAGGRSRLRWVLSRQPVAVFVLELGGNDGLRGLPLTDTRANLQAIMDTVRQQSPKTKIVLAGMQIPPNMGQAYTAEFKGLYADLAKKNNVVLIPFLLENVGGVARLNQPDGIHPTPEGHRLVARTVWRTLGPIIN